MRREIRIFLADAAKVAIPLGLALLAHEFLGI